MDNRMNAEVKANEFLAELQKTKGSFSTIEE